MAKRTKKIKDDYLGSERGQRSLRYFLYSIGMKTKKQKDYLETCYLCGTACSASNNSKGIWITDTILASVCAGCFERNNGWSKKDTARPDLETLGAGDWLIGKGLLNSVGWSEGTVKNNRLTFDLARG
jgi:hypothetical protein